MKINSEYQCLSCNHHWLGGSFPQTCPVCNHLYVKLIGRSEYYPFQIVANADGWYNIIDLRSGVIIEEDLTSYIDAEIISKEKQTEIISK